jgi:hypothetical protein
MFDHQPLESVQEWGCTIKPRDPAILEREKIFSSFFFSKTTLTLFPPYCHPSGHKMNWTENLEPEHRGFFSIRKRATDGGCMLSLRNVQFTKCKLLCSLSSCLTNCDEIVSKKSMESPTGSEQGWPIAHATCIYLSELFTSKLAVWPDF